MSSNTYTSKYPTIVVDKSSNSVNERMIKKITVEEYYDLKHHTHDMSSLSVAEGEMSYGEMQTVINNLNSVLQEQQNFIIDLQQENKTLQNTVNELTENINNANDTILHQSDIIQRLEADTTELKMLIATQNETIDAMKSEMENMASVSDWDVETPGNQDINGNDLGTFMGYTMTEIP